MIDIDKLSPSDIGRWVVYSILPPNRDRGRIKSWTRQFVYVVFRCGGDFDNYTDYTTAPTLPEYLNFESREPEKAIATPRPPHQNPSGGNLGRRF